MPVYNAASFLNEAIESILNQTFSKFEFLIINDGSTDNSEDIILTYNDPRIKYVKNESNIKLIATLNKGIDIAKGKYIARMDADDISMPNRIKKQYDYLEKNIEIAAVSTWFSTFSSNNEATSCYALKHEEIKFKQLYNIQICHGASMIRKSTLEKHNLKFDDSYVHAEDYDFFTRLSNISKLANIDYFGYKVRDHENEISKLYSNIQTENSTRVIKREFNKLGYDINDLQIDTFRKLNHFEYNTITESFKEVENLLMKLIEHNEVNNYINKKYLKEKLAYLWYHHCYNKKLKDVFFNSALSKSSSVSFKDKLKMRIKGF